MYRAAQVAWQAVLERRAEARANAAWAVARRASRILPLAGRIREELDEVARTAERARLLAEKASASGDDGYLDGVALNLHSFYTGVEHILEEIAREIDRSVPAGPDWNRDLLLQMTAEMKAVRPAVLSRDARLLLDEYRGFRHIVRNVYAFHLRPNRLRQLVDGLEACVAALTENLDAFLAFLTRNPPIAGE